MKLTFFSKSGGDELSCLYAKLSNGVTLKSVAIPWITGLVTIVFATVVGILGMMGGANHGGAAPGNNASMTATAGDPPGTLHAATTGVGSGASQTGPA